MPEYAVIHLSPGRQQTPADHVRVPMPVNERPSDIGGRGQAAAAKSTSRELLPGGANVPSKSGSRPMLNRSEASRIRWQDCEPRLVLLCKRNSRIMDS